jgi:hypothetical protein
MHGQAYLRKGMIAHLNTALEEYLWLASQVPAGLLDTAPAGGQSVRAALLDLAMRLDTVAYPTLIALIEGQAPPEALAAEQVAARARAWAAADLMVAMKQMRYRFQATETLLHDTADIAWGSAEQGPSPLARAVFALWQDLLARLHALAGLVAALPGAAT